MRIIPIVAALALVALLDMTASAGEAAPVEPKLQADPALLRKIADLPGDTWLKLPNMKVTGDLDWVAAFNWKSMRQRGPYGRDYSCKAAWMPDRRRAVYAGGGHNIRPFNDVWEYDLAANTWVCLYGADTPAQGRKPEWMKENLVVRDGALQTRRGGPPRLSHTFDGWNYDPLRRVAFMPESLRGAVFVDAKTVAQGLGMTGEELKARWKPAPYFLTFDPYQRKWGYVTEGVPKCGRDPSARYIAHLKSWWVSSGGSIGLYDPETGTTRQLSRQGAGGGYSSSTVYDPDTRSIVVITPGGKKAPAATWVYSLDGDNWKKTQSAAPAGGCSSSGYFDYDTAAKRCVLYSKRCQPNFWTYDVKANRWTPADFKGESPGGGYVIGYYDPDRDVLVHYDSRDVWVCRLKTPKEEAAQ